MLKDKKWYLISLFTIVCILLNFMGKVLAEKLGLPLWLDSFGTVLSAYTAGPVCGAIVGATANIMFGFSAPAYYFYAITNIVVAVTVGVCAKKKWLESLFGTLSVATLVAVLSVVVSLPVNCVFFDGYTSNLWGDGVIDFLRELGCPTIFCYIAGEFYIDFLDKVLLVLILFFLVKLVRKYRREKTGASVGVFLAVILATGSFFTTKVYAQESPNQFSKENDTVNFNTYVQTIYDDNSGLPGGEANDIAQTKDGVLWIGTYGGLYRYDGGQFQWMDEFESVRNVNCLYSDEEGRLWIGTNDNGLSICIDDKISNVVDEEDGLPSNSVRCISESAKGDYYVGTTDCMAVVRLSSGLSICETIPEIVYANSVTSDSQGNVVTVTDEGKLYLLRDAKVISRRVAEPAGETYTCCKFGEDGRLYVATSSNRIDVFSIQEDSLKKLSSVECAGLSNIKSINFGMDEIMFVCSDNGVGYIDQAGEYRIINTNEFNSSIDHMLVDYQENLWFTSSRMGLLKLCETAFTEIYSKAGLKEKVVNTVTKWQGRLYFGTDSGLDVVDEAVTKEQQDALKDELEGVRIRCLMVDSGNHMWICTSGKGIWEVKTNGEKEIYNSAVGTLGDKFRTVIEMKDGTIAAASDAGITYIKNGAVIGKIGYDEGLRNPKVLSMLEREDGSLLVGTDGNGIALIKDGVVTDTWDRSDGLSSEVILRMVPDSLGEGIYIVTGNGLCFMDEDGKVRLLDNFPYYNNYDLVEGKNGELLVLGSAGIYVVDRQKLLDGEKVDYELLNAKRGLRQSLTVNSRNYMDEEGGIYLSTNEGVVYMNLYDYDRAVRSYRMLLKTIKVDGVSYSVERGETTYIPSGTDKIEIIPGVVNYSPNDPDVSVYLEGFDKARTVIPQSELTSLVYTNLHAGDYVFHLAILDEKNGRVMEESTYKLVKEKEIYDYWWFRLYVVAVFLFAIFYFTWLFARTQVQKRMNLQKKELELVKRQVEMGNETILTIARTVDAKDENTSQHSLRVSTYSVLIAQKMGYSKNECEELRKTAMLHDIGKIGIPDSVLNKPARLTNEEYDIMKSHVVKGAEILKNLTLVDHVADGALYHHERYDGKGYVHGLKGEEIPLNARIIGIADAFDAMTANRVYRKKLDFDFVLEELKKGRGTQFDPGLVDILLGLIEDGTINVQQLYEEGEQS